MLKIICEAYFNGIVTLREFHCINGMGVWIKFDALKIDDSRSKHFAL